MTTCIICKCIIREELKRDSVGLPFCKSCFEGMFGRKKDMSMYSRNEIDRAARKRSVCLTEVWDRLIRFDDKHFPGWRGEGEIYYSNALAGEVGELCNKVKKRLGGGTSTGPPPTVEELLEELADVFIYMSLFVEVLGHGAYDITTLADAIDRKIAKNEKRVDGTQKLILSYQ